MKNRNFVMVFGFLAMATACADESAGQSEQNSSVLPANVDGPFGLDLSLPASKIEYDEKSSFPDEGKYTLDKVPKPSSDFVDYRVLAFPNVGICQIIAFTTGFGSDSLGAKARSITDKIASALTQKYGKPEKLSVCGGDEISCSSEFWAQSIQSGIRLYAYKWKNLRGYPDIREIQMKVISIDSLENVSMLNYYVNDRNKCDYAQSALSAEKL